MKAVARRILVKLLPSVLLSCLALLSACGSKAPDKSPRPSQRTTRSVTAERPKLARKVLVVQSYHADNEWVASVERGVKNVLDTANVPFESFYMDTKRKTDPAWLAESGRLAEAKLAAVKPGVVIVADDNAQEHFAKKLLGTQQAVVFCAVSEDPSKFGFPAPNVTGIMERVNFAGGVELLNRIKPVKRMALLSCKDTKSTGVFGHINAGKFAVNVVDSVLASTFDEWKAAVLRFNTSVDAVAIYNYHTLKRGTETTSMAPLDVMVWTRENLKLPSIGFQSFTVNDGALAGLAEDGVEQGERAAQYALKILDGTPASSLPVVHNTVGQRLVNKDTAAKLGIALPDDVVAQATLVGWTPKQPEKRK
jgi:ABC-type uncharacterized transport system substrate-binding protein